MKKPIIGIMVRSNKLDDDRSIIYIFDSVRSSIIKSGGEPLLLCPPEELDYFKTSWTDFPDITSSEAEGINYWLNMCDGLFLPGGIKYTKFDAYVLDLAIKKNMPILGVCLGMQLMSNYQKEFKIEEIDSDIDHSRSDLEYCHKISIKKNSLLDKIVSKEELNVNSFHRRQAFDNPLFESISYAPDGVLEAIEMKEKRFVLGVQWHPEAMIGYDQDARKIMEYFIEEAKFYKKSNDKGKIVRL